MLVEGEERQESLQEAAPLKRIVLSSREAADLIMLGMGAFSPLTGFLGSGDYASVVKDMHLADGVLWPIPITLATSREQAGSLAEAEKVALVSETDGEMLAILELREKYEYDKELEVKEVFGTTAAAHPGVAKVYAQGEVYLAGPVKVLSEGGYPERFPQYARPLETRQIFRAKGWQTIAAFQTRNPIHRAHEYCTKIALETSDGLFIHPIVGRLKPGDVPAEVRLRCYEALLKNYYPPERVVLKVYPLEMRYGGPREAVLHAIIRQNFGCSHLIVGRDHAGVGDYYGHYDAQKIFDQIGPGELQLKPLRIDNCFWCYQCESMCTDKTCPHSGEQRLIISGTELRQMLSTGEMPPPEFSRPEVMRILAEYYGVRGAPRKGDDKA